MNIPYKITSKFGFKPVSDNGKDEVVYYCPYCLERKGTSDTKGKLYVNIKTGVYHCFRCGISGYISGKNIDKDKRYAEDKGDLEEEQLLTDLNQVFFKDEFPLKIPIDKVTISKTATDYLIKRGFTLEQMKYYDMRVGNTLNEFGRVIIPNRVDKLVYTDMYSARSYIGQEPKYHNPYGVNKSEIVFNLHRIKEHTPIILVEGVLTAIASGYHAVASYGKVLSKTQAYAIISKKPSVMYVNYDYGAEQELEDACKLLYSISPDIPIKQVFMKDERDSADMSKEEYIECIKNSIDYKPLLNDLLGLILE